MINIECSDQKCLFQKVVWSTKISVMKRPQGLIWAFKSKYTFRVAARKNSQEKGPKYGLDFDIGEI